MLVYEGILSDQSLLRFVDKNAKLPILIAIPTTLGTGSEVTPFSTYYHNGIKVSVDKPEVRPDICIVDAELSESLSKYQAACSGVDAVCQSMESLWALAANSESRAYARKSLLLAREFLTEMIQYNTPEARAAMAMAAHLSGKAISITRTTAPHAYSYALTVNYGVPHGHAVALFMGPILQLHAQGGPGIPEGLKHLQDYILGLIGVRKKSFQRSHWEALLEEWGLAPNIESLGISLEVLEGLLAEVNSQRLENHPVIIEKKSLLEVFRC